MRLILAAVLMLAAGKAAAAAGGQGTVSPNDVGAHNNPPATSVASDETALSPMVRSALRGLSAEDFPAREKAAAKLELALGREMQALIQVNDPEAQARVNDLLTFEEGLCAWVHDVLQMPADKQADALAFGLQPDILPHAAHLYARDSAVRLDAVRALRGNPDPRVMELLAKALEDRDQQVYVAAMEAVYDRPPTDAVVDKLWNRAVAAQFATFHPQPQMGPDHLTFLGRSIQAINNGDNDLYLRTQDNALATDVLVHMKPPQVVPKVRALLADAEAAFARRSAVANPDQNMWMYLPSQEAMRNAIRIAEALKEPELVPGLYRIATGPLLQRSQGQIGQQVYFWSNRTWALALVLELTDQSPADWNLRQLVQLQGMWAMPMENDEQAAVSKLRDWWAENHAKYGGAPDTRPAAPDVIVPPAERAQRRGAIIIDN